MFFNHFLLSLILFYHVMIKISKTKEILDPQRTQSTALKEFLILDHCGKHSKVCKGQVTLSKLISVEHTRP